MSYLFIAIIWINHHYLMELVGPPTLRLIWMNFAHLFMVSFLPFATALIARTQLAPAPVAFYAALFVCVDTAYNIFEREVFRRAMPRRCPPERGAGRGADLSLFLRSSQPRRLSRSSRRALPSV